MSNLTKYRIQLSDEILGTQICTVCKKYLSYPPTKIYATGEIKCGRCSEKNDSGVLSTFNKLTEGFLFPCVNSYEGCQHWLTCKEVPQHEETCKGGNYNCPFCPENSSKSESALYLLHHFKINHKKFILDTPIIQIIRGKDTRQHYFYYNLQTNLFVLIFLQLNNNTLFVSASTVVQKPELLKVKVKIFYPKTVLMTSLWKACAPWNSNLDGINFNLKDDPNNFCVTFEFQNHNFMLRYVTSRPETNSLEIIKEKQVPVVKTDLNTTKSNDDNISSGRNSLLASQAKPYENHFWTEKEMMPKLCLDNLEDQDLRRCLENQIFSDCGTCIVNERGWPVLYIRCSICENYYVTIPSCTDVFRCATTGCTYSTCYRCRDITFCCPIHINGFNRISKGLSCFVNYYYFCRYSCGTSYSGTRLADHESQCNQNPYGSDATLGTLPFLRKNFGQHISPNYHLSTSNLFLLRELPDYIDRVYVIDPRGYKYYLDVKRSESGNRYVFDIHHEYNPEKYKVIVRIYENNLIGEEHEVLQFSLNYYSIYTAFAILFREVSNKE